MRKLTMAEVRGMGRLAAREGKTVGRAWRVVCREYQVPKGSWTAFAAAFDDEQATTKDD